MPGGNVFKNFFIFTQQKKEEDAFVPFLGDLDLAISLPSIYEVA